MPKFPIWWKIPTREYTRDERNSPILRLELDSEWAIVFRLIINCCVCNGLKSIEIHRRNTTGEYSISGNLGFTGPDGSHLTYVPQQTFSACIKAGASFAKIHTHPKGVDFYPDISLVGHVDILECRAKRSSANAESNKRKKLRSLEKLSTDLERILNPESSCFADVTLKCNGVSIPAHKVVLSARSPVFAAMFANPLIENEVDITDMEEAVLRDLLMFVYTGKIDLTVSSAAGLLFAADIYQIRDLKAACMHFLKTSVSLETVWKILILGDLRSEDLKSFAVDYICRKGGDFSVLKTSPEFKSLRKERPELTMDLLESLVQYRDEKLKKSNRREGKR